MAQSFEVHIRNTTTDPAVLAEAATWPRGAACSPCCGPGPRC
ncbi:hypothetical protein ACIQCF_37755 [Streptomyces sp. NPDC088353]